MTAHHWGSSAGGSAAGGCSGTDDGRIRLALVTSKHCGVARSQAGRRQCAGRSQAQQALTAHRCGAMQRIGALWPPAQVGGSVGDCKQLVCNAGLCNRLHRRRHLARLPWPAGNAEASVTRRAITPSLWCLARPASNPRGAKFHTATETQPRSRDIPHKVPCCKRAVTPASAASPCPKLAVYPTAVCVA